MVTMDTAIISLAENRLTLTIIGHCPLMVTAENSNTPDTEPHTNYGHYDEGWQYSVQQSTEIFNG